MFKELHEWIDEDNDDRGVNHRSKKHYYTKELKDEVSKKFGGAQAVSEWLFHIALDNLDTYYTNEWNFNNKRKNFIKFGFSRSGYIFCEEGQIEDEDNDAWLEEFETYEEKDLDVIKELGNLIADLNPFKKDEPGYCIRCGDEIEFNPHVPYCKKCYIIWKKYEDANYPEKYCHDCGKGNRTTKSKPVCYKCYKESK